MTDFISSAHGSSAAMTRPTPAGTSQLTNGTTSHLSKPIELLVPLDDGSTTTVQLNLHLHLTIHATTIQLFVTSGASLDEGVSNTSRLSTLGSFVFSMPNRHNPCETSSTTLYFVGSTIDFTTRLARVLARKTGKGVYVGNSASFAGAVSGGSLEEERDGFKRVVDVVMDRVHLANGVIRATSMNYIDN